ncbi:MAG: OmpA family protein [Cyclobacteriaceae bacterium]
MKNFIYPILFLLLVTCNVQAQKTANYSTKSKKAIKFYKQSEVALKERNFKGGIQLLEQALLKDPSFLEAHLKLATTHLLMGSTGPAQTHYEKAVNVAPNDPVVMGAYYSLAESYHKAGNYEKSLRYGEKFLSFNPPPRLKKDAEKLLQNIAVANKLRQEPLPFDPKPLPRTINAYELQYFPVLTADQSTLIFTRRQGRDPQFDENMVISHKDAEGNWTAPVSLSENVNTKFNEGTSTISANGRTLIFTSCSGRQNYGSCDLFITYKIGEDWTEPENMGKGVNSRGWESQPSLSADGRVLYFVSDRPGGLGQRDIWVSYWRNGAWEGPYNLGPSINTPAEEVSPFIHVNGETLYFSSKGYPGLGGYDIYFSNKNEGAWSVPQNIGYPITTHDDQVSLFISADGQKGYYSYEQRSGTNYHSFLYEFEVPEAIQVANKSNFVKGNIYDVQTKLPLTAQVELFDINADTLKSAVDSDSLSGEYMMVLTQGSEYALYVNKPGYIFESLSFDYKEKMDLEPITIDIYLKPIERGVAATLKNLFFDVNRYVLKDKSKTELDKVIRFLEANPKLRMEISGHTDNSGTRAHNQTLSTNRAKSVFDYLIDAGIDSRRLRYKGYGSTLPIAANDTPENKQLNRRIEFRVI